MKRSCLILAATLASACFAGSETDRRSPVGMPARIEQIVLKGSELEARPIEDRQAPLVLRVVASYRHGTAYRYDLEYYGLEPGQYDLRAYLRRKDGSSAEDLPPLPVEIQSRLPVGQMLPSDLEPRPAPRLGGYHLVLSVGIVLWLAGLAALLFMRRRQASAQRQDEETPASLVERLRPLVESAVAGKLSTSEQAELERLLLSYWSRRVGLQETDPAVALVQLRQHPEAGALLRQMERWLHRPGGGEQIDVGEILAPYRNLPDDRVSELAASGGKTA